MHDQIIQLLRKKPLKPSALAKKLGISRQALHKHLRVMMEKKQIRKNGTGPHVTYAAMAQTMTRIQKDYDFCREELLPQYVEQCVDPCEKYVQGIHRAGKKQKVDLRFLLDSSAVYSSNIEGNTLNLNSFLNSRMAPKKHRPKEAKEIEDLVLAYEYARTHTLKEKHVLHAHRILSKGFVSPSRQGIYRGEPVGVYSRSGLEYMAVEAHLVEQEMQALFGIVAILLQENSVPTEHFFWATWLHLMIALIHPFSDGNGRIARLCEKWFLSQTIGKEMFALQNEECYWKNLSQYYAALKIGANYWEVDMKKALSFFYLIPQNI